MMLNHRLSAGLDIGHLVHGRCPRDVPGNAGEKRRSGICRILDAQDGWEGAMRQCASTLASEIQEGLGRVRTYRSFTSPLFSRLCALDRASTRSFAIGRWNRQERGPVMGVFGRAEGENAIEQAGRPILRGAISLIASQQSVLKGLELENLRSTVGFRGLRTLPCPAHVGRSLGAANGRDRDHVIGPRNGVSPRAGGRADRAARETHEQMRIRKLPGLRISDDRNRSTPPGGLWREIHGTLVGGSPPRGAVPGAATAANDGRPVHGPAQGGEGPAAGGAG